MALLLVSIKTYGEEASSHNIAASHQDAPHKATMTQTDDPVSQRPSIHLLLYKNSIVAATKKLLVNMRQGTQNVVYTSIPKTINISSILPFFENSSLSGARILSQSTQDTPKGMNLLLEAVSMENHEAVLNLNYTFTGIDWEVSYVAIMNPDQKSMTLHGWIEVSNHCGTDIHNAQLIFEGGSSKSSAEGATFVHQAGDFRYILPKIITLRDGEKSYITFLHQENIPLTQENVLDVGGDALYDLRGDTLSLSSKRSLSFANTQDLGLSMMIPHGQVTLYQKEEHGLTYLLGTTTLLDTPFGENALLQVEGDVYGGIVSAELEQTDYSKKSKRMMEAGYSVYMHNKSTSVVNLKVIIPMEGGAEGTIIRSTPVSPEFLSTHYRGRAKGASDIHWLITLQPQQEMELKYRLKRDGVL